MVRCYNSTTKRPNCKYQRQFLQTAVASVRDKKMSIRKASVTYAIPYSTLQEHCSRPRDRPERKYGGQTVLSVAEEEELVQILLKCQEWKFPLRRREVMIIVQDYLNALGRRTRFKDNKPGRDWWIAFKARHPVISEKLCKNIKRVRGSITKEGLEEYFRELRQTLEGVPVQNILNYDETNFTDDPGEELVSYNAWFCCS